MMYAICSINGDNKATGYDKYVVLNFGKYDNFACGRGVGMHLIARDILALNVHHAAPILPFAAVFDNRAFSSVNGPIIG